MDVHEVQIKHEEQGCNDNDADHEHHEFDETGLQVLYEWDGQPKREPHDRRQEQQLSRLVSGLISKSRSLVQFDAAAHWTYLREV
jgi:hypothetical protein